METAFWFNFRAGGAAQAGTDGGITSLVNAAVIQTLRRSVASFQLNALTLGWR